ncbi:hypothetical protein TNCV_491031 [Trichonephila clavipes]|nr:hypothetical protein TNCV_491031 [Trichonephila clavipes]
MPDDNVVKKVLEFGIRRRGRPRLRWTDSVESDFGILSEKTWRTKNGMYCDVFDWDEPYPSIHAKIYGFNQMSKENPVTSTGVERIEL